jgi:hypothetical protein
MVAARQKTYVEFDSKRNETDEAKIKEQLELANQVASLLRHNLAQAVRVEGSDNVYCKFHFLSSSCRGCCGVVVHSCSYAQPKKKKQYPLMSTHLALQLNSDHELGDNETLRQASKLRRLKNQEAAGKTAGGGCGTPSCCSA